LEWSTPSPVPFYNFAVTPEVEDRDPFWATKQARAAEAKIEPPVYEAITLPKSSAIGLYVGVFAFLLGFGAIWHIVWLCAIGLFGVVVCIIVRSNDDHTEHHISAKKLEELDAQARKQESYA
jgi:cytochrome o ubiquinol oxidase subunit 1